MLCPGTGDSPGRAGYIGYRIRPGESRAHGCCDQRLRVQAIFSRPARRPEQPPVPVTRLAACHEPGQAGDTLISHAFHRTAMAQAQHCEQYGRVTARQAEPGTSSYAVRGYCPGPDKVVQPLMQQRDSICRDSKASLRVGQQNAWPAHRFSMPCPVVRPRLQLPAALAENGHDHQRSAMMVRSCSGVRSLLKLSSQPR
jgi:hypothetical protein